MKPVLRYIELFQGGCGLSTERVSEIVRRQGTGNIQRIRNATQRDVDWVRGMGGKVPDGRILKERT